MNWNNLDEDIFYKIVKHKKRYLVLDHELMHVKIKSSPFVQKNTRYVIVTKNLLKNGYWSHANICGISFDTKKYFLSIK